MTERTSVRGGYLTDAPLLCRCEARARIVGIWSPFPVAWICFGPNRLLKKQDLHVIVPLLRRAVAPASSGARSSASTTASEANERIGARSAAGSE